MGMQISGNLAIHYRRIASPPVSSTPRGATNRGAVVGCDPGYRATRARRAVVDLKLVGPQPAELLAGFLAGLLGTPAPPAPEPPAPTMTQPEPAPDESAATEEQG